MYNYLYTYYILHMYMFYENQSHIFLFNCNIKVPNSFDKYPEVLTR